MAITNTICDIIMKAMDSKKERLIVDTHSIYQKHINGLIRNMRIIQNKINDDCNDTTNQIIQLIKNIDSIQRWREFLNNFKNEDIDIIKINEDKYLLSNNKIIDNPVLIDLTEFEQSKASKIEQCIDETTRDKTQNNNNLNVKNKNNINQSLNNHKVDKKLSSFYVKRISNLH